MKKLLLLILFVCSTLIVGQGKYGINVSGGISFPTGDFSDYYQSGFHGSIAFSYNMNPAIQLSLITGYSRWDIDEDKFKSFWSESQELGELSAEGNITAIPLLLSFKYSILSSKKFRPYFQFAAGAHFLTSKLEGSVRIDAATTIPLENEDISRTETTINLGIGTAIKLSKMIWLDLNGRYNLMNDSEAIQSPDNDFSDTSLKSRTLQYLSFMAGIEIYF